MNREDFSNYATKLATEIYDLVNGELAALYFTINFIQNPDGKNLLDINEITFSPTLYGNSETYNSEVITYNPEGYSEAETKRIITIYKNAIHEKVRKCKIKNYYIAIQTTKRTVIVCGGVYAEKMGFKNKILPSTDRLLIYPPKWYA